VSAPLLIVNARVWSGVALGPRAVLVRDGRVAGLGEADALLAAAPDARVLDADGTTLTPGLTDAHVHLVPWAQARRQADLHGAGTLAAALARVRDALAALPPGQTPLVGRGWDESAWEEAPVGAALDALAPMRPVLLHRHDFHALWVNSAALLAAGVSRATPDPAGGRFERDAAGELTGIVREHAVRVFHALEDRAGPEPSEALLDEAAAALHAEGVTSVHDFQRNDPDARRTAALAGRHRLRVLQHVGPDQVRDAAAHAHRGGEGDAWFRWGSLKLFADGTLGSRTAALLAPYDDAPGTGMVLLSPAELAAEIARAAAAGFSVTIHAIGDAAVRHALDAIEQHQGALAELPLPPRIEHAQLVDPADLSRFASLGVTASMQPQHFTTDAPVARQAWGARCRNAYPWRSLLDSGASLAFGSDAPVEPPLARLGLASAVARLTADGQPLEPGQAISLDAALTAYTSVAARLAAGGLGHGAVQVGEPADLVVWDRDLHEASAEGLAAARPRWTVLAGEIVYDSGQDRTHAGPASVHREARA
jgi:predicted amidohydrolase YtcJ